MEVVCIMMGIKPKKVGLSRLYLACRLLAALGSSSLCPALPYPDSTRRPFHSPHPIYLHPRPPHHHHHPQINDPANPSKKVDDYWTPSQVRFQCVGF